MDNIRYFMFSALFVAGYDLYFFEADNSLGYESVFNIMLFSFAYLLLKREKRIAKRTKQYALLFSLPFSAALALGRFLYHTHDLKTISGSVGGIAAFGIIMIGFMAVFRAMCAMIFERFLAECTGSKEDQQIWKIFRTPWYVLWGVIFVSWLPAFLAFYPGICSYDSNSQTTQAVQGMAHYTKYHPPLHTLVWAICLKIGNSIPLHPLCIYSLLQMFFLALVLAKMMSALIQRRVNNYSILFGILFIAANPVMAIFACEMTKDAFLAIFFVLLTLYLLELAGNAPDFLHKKANWGKLMLTLCILCLLRNNMVHACILCMPLAAFIMKDYWKQVVVLFMLPILCFFFVNGFVYEKMGIAEGDAREGLSVPIQQIAYAVNANEQDITLEEREEIQKYISYDVILTSYNPRLADPVKFSFITENYETDKAGFWKLWLALFRKYPQEYVSAFLTLNLPYWYPDACPVDHDSGRQYIEVGMDSGPYYSILTDSKLPWLYSLYLRFANFEALRNIPVICRIYLLSTPLWFLLLAVVMLLLKGEKRKILTLLPSICLWITYMAGPVSNFRYIFPIFALYPLIAGIIFSDAEYADQSLKNDV